MKTIMDEHSDAELFYLLTSDKVTAEKAFGELYRRHSSRVFGYCKKFLGNEQEAQDVFQETMIRFFQSANPDREMTNVPAFILRIARNLCVNNRRKDRSTVVPFEDWMIGNSNHRQDKDELLSLINKAIEKLPEEYKDVFILREYEGFSYGEIADMIDESLSTVKIRIYRAKKKVREMLQPYLADLIKHE